MKFNIDGNDPYRDSDATLYTITKCLVFMLALICIQHLVMVAGCDPKPTASPTPINTSSFAPIAFSPEEERTQEIRNRIAQINSIDLAHVSPEEYNDIVIRIREILDDIYENEGIQEQDIDTYAFKFDQDANGNDMLYGWTKEDFNTAVMCNAGEVHSDHYPLEMYIFNVSVMINRVDSRKFPNTMYAVFHEEGQYSCLKDGNALRNPSNKDMLGAYIALKYGSVLPSRVLFSSNHLDIGDDMFTTLYGVFYNTYKGADN